MKAQGVWLNKKMYEDAEIAYYEKSERVAPLAKKVIKTQQKLVECMDTLSTDINSAPVDVGALKFIEKKVFAFEKSINQILDQLKSLDIRVSSMENSASPSQGIHEINIIHQPQILKQHLTNDDDDDVDLFASDSDEGESAEAAKIREERLAAYAAKKSKKPALIAKSNIILDIKPWDDETDMKVMETEVRKIECDGLLWGVSKLVPLAFGIHKLQIASVVEDDKVSIDWLQEQIEAIEDYVQSVDIAAFNKI